METKQKTVKEKKPVEETVEAEVKESPIAETVEFTGKYLKTVGRRKTSVAQVRMYSEGKGAIMVNGKKGSLYFPGEGINIVSQPLKATNESG